MNEKPVFGMPCMALSRHEKQKRKNAMMHEMRTNSKAHDRLLVKTLLAIIAGLLLGSLLTATGCGSAYAVPTLDFDYEPVGKGGPVYYCECMSEVHNGQRYEYCDGCYNPDGSLRRTPTKFTDIVCSDAGTVFGEDGTALYGNDCHYYQGNCR